MCLFAEIALGIYTYMNFESLMTRFLFFIFTAACVALIVVKLANKSDAEENEETSSAIVGEGQKE